MIALLLHLGFLFFLIWLLGLCLYAIPLIFLFFYVCIPALFTEDQIFVINYSLFVLIFVFSIIIKRKEVLRALKLFFKHPIKNIKNGTNKLWQHIKKNFSE